MNSPEMAEGTNHIGHAPYLYADARTRRLAAVGMMTTGIVHDLGNIVQVFASAMHLIEDGLGRAASVRMRSVIREALQSVERAVALNKQILGFSRVENVIEEPVGFRRVLAGIRNPIFWLAGPDVRVEMSVAEDLPDIFCNVLEFENVILNLVANARDAMPDGGVLGIYVRCEEGGQPPNVVLRVTDTGLGMSPQKLKQAFQPFFTTKPAGQGSGLGLAAVGEFVRRSGGLAQIESTPGRGTSVILRFPGCCA